MEAKELRIGNLVSVTREKDNQKYEKVVSLTAVGIETFSIKEDDLIKVAVKDKLNPIPLTEEIIVKCGFEKYEGDDYPFYTRHNLVISDSYYGYGLFIIYTDHYGFNDPLLGANEIDVKLQDVKYVHQLQNLYFALTGEELDIEL